MMVALGVKAPKGGNRGLLGAVEVLLHDPVLCGCVRFV